MFLIFTLWKPSCAIFIFKININAKIFNSSWTNSSVPLCLTNRRPRIHQKKLIKILRKPAILWIIRTRNTLQDAVPQAVGKVDFWVSKCAEINSKREVKQVLDIINCHSPTQPQLELELDLIMGRNPPTPPHRNF